LGEKNVLALKPKMMQTCTFFDEKDAQNKEKIKRKRRRRKRKTMCAKRSPTFLTDLI